MVVEEKKADGRYVASGRCSRSGSEMYGLYPIADQQGTKKNIAWFASEDIRDQTVRLLNNNNGLDELLEVSSVSIND